jgi:hypothetical protein
MRRVKERAGVAPIDAQDDGLGHRGALPRLGW